MGADVATTFAQMFSSSQSSGSSNTSNTYSAPQTGVQNDLGTTLSGDLAAANKGTLSTGNTAALTSANDATNKTASGLTDRINRMLATRGFGASGQTGKATLQGELGRESQIGSNTSAAYTKQGNENSSNLLAALNYAFTSLGSGTTAQGQSSGSSTEYGVGADAGFKVPGFK